MSEFDEKSEQIIDEVISLPAVNVVANEEEDVGFIETFASTIGTFGTGTTVINDNISSSGFVLASNITASGNISASGDLTVNSINGTINGGAF